MALVTRQGQNPPPPNTDTPPHHMTPELVQAMIDQAFLRNSTNGDGSQSVRETIYNETEPPYQSSPEIQVSGYVTLGKYSGRR
uniref:Reverse transcriptase domain-containing protein n=1 Tax=Tanacetum cinerariifolium TaxID=118510 RepID=A0A699RX82_TANCI|nr:hypothetical protein [Tanacetum cinerariifolium]